MHMSNSTPHHDPSLQKRRPDRAASGPRHPCFLVLLLLVLPVVSANGEVRIWKDDKQREVRAKFLGLDNGNLVRLELENGRQATFPLANLSQACRSYVATHVAAENDDPSRAEAGKENFTTPWPTRVGCAENLNIEIISENIEAKEFVYSSTNFRFISDAKLTAKVVKEFAGMFEATWAYCNAIPLGLGKGELTDGKYLIKLFERRQDYYAAGGAAFPGSSGFFSGEMKRIIIPFDSLGLRKVGSAYTVDRSTYNRILPHEITHQLTPVPYFGNTSPNFWLSEGLADYVATTPYSSGSYNLRNHRKDLVEYVTGHSGVDGIGRDLGSKIDVMPFKDFMLLPVEAYGASGNLNYGVALLIVYYFIHLDGEGDAARFKAYCQALLKGESSDEATKLLLDGRSLEQLEEAIHKAWRTHGVSLKFDSKLSPQK
jgi:hypothetical protein